MTASSKEKMQLLIVAHPDDETIFFGGTVLARRKENWHIICVTDGNADGQGKLRAKQFSDACRFLGAKKCEMWELPDIYEKRLDQKVLAKKLAKIKTNVREVFTHGPLGEYGHPHHQDVSHAVHKFFAGQVKIFSPAYNLYPEFRVPFGKAEYARKFDIMSRIYKSEVERFIHLLPATWEEGFVQVAPAEVAALHKYLSGASSERPKRLQKFKHLAPFIDPSLPRPF